MSTPKVLTITLRFDMGDRKIHAARIKAASDAAVDAASDAVESALLEGSVAKVTATTTWAYHWAEYSTATILGEEEANAEDETSVED